MSRLLIQFSHFSKSFGPILLFDDISLSISEGEIFALIGENGAGKTTLLQILCGILQPDSGQSARTPHFTIGFLPQEIPSTQPQITAREFIDEGPLSLLEQQMTICLNDPARIVEWAELHEQYEKLGGYRRLPIEQILSGLKLELILDMKMQELSSGQRIRIALAKALIEEPDLLLLDEPTNHLDQEMQTWLQETLRARKGATIIVSHDRKFLNQTCNHLIELKHGKLTRFGGNYEYYLQEQKRIVEKEMKAYADQIDELSSLKQKIKDDCNLGFENIKWGFSQ